MALKDADLNLLKRYADQLEDLEAKKKVTSERDNYEQKAKRIRRDANAEMAAHPENAAAIVKQEEDLLQEAYQAFWQHTGPEMLEWFSTLDFEVVYPYMKEIWPLNELLRNHDPSWRQRLSLEYPDYWMLNKDGETGLLSERSVQELLEDTTKGSGPRSRAPTRADSLYLLYQKARRLTRFINKRANGELKGNAAASPPLDYQDLDLEIESDIFPTIVDCGRHVAAVQFFLVGDEDEPASSVVQVSWIDLAKRETFNTGRVDIGDLLELPTQLYGGEGALLLRWKYAASEHVNVLNLNSGKWSFPAPVDITLGLRQFNASFSSMNRVNIVKIEVPDEDGDVEVFDVMLKEFVGWIKRGMKTSPVADLQLDGRQTIFPGDVILEEQDDGSVYVFGRWVPRKRLPDNGNMRGEFVRFNFNNSYQYPLLHRYGPKGNDFLTDMRTLRKAEKGNQLPRYEAYRHQSITGVYFGGIVLLDRSDEMRSPGAMTAIKLDSPDQVAHGLFTENNFVFGNLICRVFPDSGRVFLYDLWSLYKLTRSDPVERERPLLSKPVAVRKALCNSCSAPATGVCANCKRISYCSAECMSRDLEEHMVQCVNSIN